MNTPTETVHCPECRGTSWNAENRGDYWLAVCVSDGYEFGEIDPSTWTVAEYKRGNFPEEGDA